MKSLYKIKLVKIVCTIGLVSFCLPLSVLAQRFNHGGSGNFGGGAPRGGGNFGGAHQAPMQAPRQSAPAPSNFRSINGGSNTGNHFFNRPTPTPTPTPANRGGFNNRPTPTPSNNGNFNNRPIPTPSYNRGGNTNNWSRGGDRGGERFHNENVFHRGYRDHPYFYHPYHPYYWGPSWHPFGFFIGALTADAFFFNYDNRGYYYDDGVYYQPSGNGYAVVAPPIGAVVNYLPDGYTTITADDGTYYYYYAGVFYIAQDNAYRVVPAPVGAIVTDIPEGAVDQVINGEHYLLYNNTYYLPVSQDGQDAYQVVQVN